MKKKTIKQMIGLVFLLGIIILLGACSKIMSEKKLDSIQYGMTEKEVEAQLGKPDESSDNATEIKKELANNSTPKSIVPKSIKKSIDRQLTDNVEETLTKIHSDGGHFTAYTYEIDSDESILLLFEENQLVSYVFMGNKDEKLSYGSMEFWCL